MMRCLFFLTLLVFMPFPAMAACTSPAGGAGQLTWFAAENTLKFCDDTSWFDLRAPSGYWGENAGNLYRAGGNVGIGTAAPEEKLDVRGNLLLNGNTLYFLKASNAAADKMAIAVDMNTIAALDFYSDERFRFFESDNNTEVFSINANGNYAVVSGNMKVNGYTQLKLNSAAPGACTSSLYGAVALSAAGEMCVCTSTNAWQKVNTATACAW